MIALVALAGGLGAGLRFVVDRLVARAASGLIPLGTFVVNVTGSFLLGLVIALVPEGDPRSVLATGLLGGYTTFSAASVEAVELARRGARGPAVAHAAAMLVLSLGAAGAGLWFGDVLSG